MAQASPPTKQRNSTSIAAIAHKGKGKEPGEPGPKRGRRTNPPLSRAQETLASLPSQLYRPGGRPNHGSLTRLPRRPGCNQGCRPFPSRCFRGLPLHGLGQRRHEINGPSLHPSLSLSCSPWRGGRSRGRESFVTVYLVMAVWGPTLFRFGWSAGTVERGPGFPLAQAVVVLILMSGPGPTCGPRANIFSPRRIGERKYLSGQIFT